MPREDVSSRANEALAFSLGTQRGHAVDKGKNGFSQWETSHSTNGVSSGQLVLT